MGTVNDSQPLRKSRAKKKYFYFLIDTLRENSGEFLKMSGEWTRAETMTKLQDRNSSRTMQKNERVDTGRVEFPLHLLLSGLT